MSVELVLFSSNSRPEYMQDNLRILAYPSGHIMHYRYRSKWVDQKLLNDLMNNNKRKQLQGKEVLIITIGNSRSSSEKASWEFYPIRKGKIVDIHEKNGVVHVYFQLSDKLIDYDKSVQTALTISLRTSFSSYATYFQSLNKTIQNILLGLKEKPLERQWGNLVDILSNDPDFKDVLFYRFELLPADNPENQVINPITHNQTSLKSKYKVQCSKEYILKVYLWKDPDAHLENDSYLQIESLSPQVIVMPSRIPIWLIADEKNVLIRIRNCSRENLTQLIIKGENTTAAYIDDIFLHLSPKWCNKEEVLLIKFAIGLLLSSGAIGAFAESCSIPLQPRAWATFILALVGVFLSTTAIGKLSSQD